MPSGMFFRRPAVLLALGLCSIGAVVTLLGRLATGPAVELKRTEITNEAGTKAYPAFSPDGKHLAYSMRGVSARDDSFHVFVRDLPGGAPRQLTDGAVNDLSPVWSPDGASIAFVRVSDEGSECVIVPSVGPGDPRTFAGCGVFGDEAQPLPALSWTRDGKSLVILRTAEQPPALALLSLDNGAIKPLTHPPAGSEGDSSPAVSPDGNTIAFVRGTSSGGADIYLCDPAGANTRPLTFDNRAIRGIAWTRDGQDLMYTADRAAGWRIWRLPVYGGSPHDLVISGRDARYVAVAPVGHRLVYTVSPTVSSIWRATAGPAEGSLEEHAVVRSSGREFGPRYSPDGKRIADISDQTGNDEIWLCDADGGNRARVTKLQGPELARLRWSPDGKSLLFDADSDRGYELYTVPAVAGGNPVRVQLDAMNGSWSHDGKAIYFQAREQVWKAAANGGSPQQVSKRPPAAQAVETLDGRYVYFRRGRTFWRVPAAGGDEEEAIVPDHDLLWSTTLQMTRKGIYYLEFSRNSREMVVSFYDFGEKKSSEVFRLKNMDRQNPTYSVSPDGKSVLYPRVDQSQTNLVVVENFR
ncbi:MAG TPA: hypothetical protein VLY04_09155 [Bryobacteraceae bacterium]|nr:hypothetical protein [Bryobacteraceae bacterium]